MSDAWGTQEMSAALDEAGNSNEAGQGSDATNIRKDFLENPQKQGWAEPESYDYSAFNDRSRAYDSSAPRYEYDGAEGDVGPPEPELEQMLFGDPNMYQPTGIDFTKIAQIELEQEGPERIVPMSTFADCNLHPVMARNVELAKYQVPTPIQKYTIPAILGGYDVIGIAQTGSGKTAAYLIPILNKLMGKARKLAAPRPTIQSIREGTSKPVRAEPLVVVIVPTRELAVQIFIEARKFCYRSMLRPCVVYGGGPVSEQLRQIELGCDVLIASPGRLIDFINRTDKFSLERLRYMVIDEADEMLQDDWREDFRQILTAGGQDQGNVCYALFSATFPKPLRDLAKQYLAENHVRFRVGRAGSVVESIKQVVIQVDDHRRKKEMLLDVLANSTPGRTIIFVNSKTTADALDDFLFHKGLPCTSMHSDRTQREREDAMRAFRAGKALLLVATGVTARGIDVPNVVHVINYDLPSMEHGGIEEYAHRIGRTGRIGHQGLATSFYGDRDEAIGSVLTRTMLEAKQEIPSFLQHFVPEGDAANHLQFEADSDFDPTDMPGAGEGETSGWNNDAQGGDSWGGGGEATTSGGDNAGDGWGTTTATDDKKDDDGWGAGAGAETSNDFGNSGW